LQLQLFLLCITCTDTPFRDSICTAPPNFFYFIFHSSKAFMNFRLVLKSKQRKKGKYQPAARIKRGSVEEKQYPSSRDVSEWFLLGSGFQAAREGKRKKTAVQCTAEHNPPPLRIKAAKCRGQVHSLCLNNSPKRWENLQILSRVFHLPLQNPSMLFTSNLDLHTKRLRS
jgi:hypothetical protein